MASIYQPRPVLASQGISHAPEYVDARRTVHGGRQPLREAAGNAQAHSFNSNIPCYQTPVSSLPPTIPPHIVPSQSIDVIYSRLQTPRHQPRHVRKSRQDINPLYYWPAFKHYRNRQAHKDTQKDKGGVWRRPELEDAFVDSVLLMPHMGRRKFSMGGKLHGRNMLISEYIFVICVALLGSKEIFRIDNSNDSIEQMGRKQVSSHMQVVKKFFEDLRCFHFLFPSEEKKEPGSTNSDDYYDEEEQESFKSNPILTALAEGRVPEVRPNYDYFTQLLSLQGSISVRPKTCEIYVSSAEIKIRDDVAYDANNTPLDQASFPHLNKYTNCDDFPDALGKDVLLHEYTRALDRATSACLKTVIRRWQKDAPAMYETLDLPTRDQDCLLLEICSTLELHEHAKFPSGSELTGFVEVAITQPELQHHHWKCVTRLTRPDELYGDDSKRGVYTNESGIHHRGCSDSKMNDCNCHLRARQDIHVPFPAVEWASILSTAVQYPDVEHQRKKEKRHESKKQHELGRAGSKRKRSEDEGDAASWSRREPTGSDLICKVAMYQELWSRAPDSSQWKRQAIIFWRFNTTNQWYKYNPVFKPSGTSWRWLTINDPMSRYHQQKALVYPSAGVSRDAVMSPTPSVSQQLAGIMNENMNTAWTSGAGVAQVPPVQTNINVFDFPTGLATPPPTATIHGPYAGGSFDPNMASMPDVNNYLPTVSTTAGGAASERSHSLSLAHNPSYFEGQAGFPDMKPMTTAGVNQYLSATTAASLDLSTQLVYDDTTSITAWDIPNLDTWPGPTTSTQAGNEWATAPSTQPRADPSDHAGLWNPTQWHIAGVATTPASAGAEHDDSPRSMKRRRTEPSMSTQHVPIPNDW
ncbi:Conidiophore development regulator abaA [Trichoderma lentiforme]|uniref:Conidiophore development regulator abaA n=1 Tax=Trichoderma lentiforme TaxID=1567552 RepID=A0A9P5C8I1_9HYPO|nr:Conidiophore development regulator abaA [Trichoderma lentiforme]